jgi:ataxin-3
MEVYWEVQDSDQLCAVHAINSLLQGPYWDAVTLASIAFELDQAEAQLYRRESGIEVSAT